MAVGEELIRSQADAGVIRQYLDKQHMMQLATSDEGRPWNCTVYYVHDDDLNLYWASLPTRRHSQEIAKNSRVAAAIAINFVMAEPVTGIQMEGEAIMMKLTPQDRPIVESYAAKFESKLGNIASWIENMLAGRTEHRLYRLTPDRIQLFDEAGFPDNPKQQIR